jgi:hypothetical protein
MGKDFYLLHRDQTGSGTHPASYPVRIEGFLLGLNDRGVKLTTHLHLVSRLRMVELYLHLSIRLQGVVYFYLYKFIGLIQSKTEAGWRYYEYKLTDVPGAADNAPH